MKKIKFHFTNEYKETYLDYLRDFEILPSVCLYTYKNYTFESIRFSWLGLTLGIYL